MTAVVGCLYLFGYMRPNKVLQLWEAAYDNAGTTYSPPGGGHPPLLIFRLVTPFMCSVRARVCVPRK